VAFIVCKKRRPPEIGGLPYDGYKSNRGLDDTLSNHGVGDAHEASDVGTLNVVDGTIFLLAVLDAHVIDVVHDGVEVLIDLFGSPVAVLSVLANLETRGGNTTGVDGLTRTEGQFSLLEGGDGGGLATHVGNLSNILHAVLDKGLGILLIKLVLEGAGHSDVALHNPALLAGSEFAEFRELLGHILNFVAVAGAHVEHIVNHLLVDTVGNLADAIGAADSDDLGTQLNCLGGSTPSNVAEAGESNLLALHGVFLLLDHALHIVDGAEASGLGTDEGTTPAVALAGQSAGAVLAGEFLVGTIEVANLAAADTHVTGGAVLIGTDVAPQLIHEGLAEAHDFSVALSDGVEIGTTLTTAERQHGEAVLEDLLETEELQHGDVDSLVEAETAFVSTEGGVELHAVAEVGLDFTLVVNPSHTEGEDTIGLNDALDDLVSLKLGVLVVFLLDGLKNLADSLQVLIFTGMFGLQVGHNFFYFHDI